MYKKSRSTIFGDIQRATDAVRKKSQSQCARTSHRIHIVVAFQAETYERKPKQEPHAHSLSLLYCVCCFLFLEPSTTILPNANANTHALCLQEQFSLCCFGKESRATSCCNNNNKAINEASIALYKRDSNDNNDDDDALSSNKARTRDENGWTIVVTS